MKHDATIIAMTGRAGSGKDTAATYLCRHYGFSAVSFAGPLKCMLEALFAEAGIDHAWLHEPHLKNQLIPELGVSGRHLMQTLGTEWGRQHVRDALWIRTMALATGLVEGGTPVHDRLVITDLRFPNEAQWLQSVGGRIVRLHRMQAGAVREHASEAFIDAMPAWRDLVNDGPTLAGFHGLLDSVMAELELDRRDEELWA